MLTRRTFITAALTLPVVATAARVQAATHAVTIDGFKFSPATLTVAAGDTIVFTNNDGAPHTATASDGAFDTGRLNRGESASVTVPAGTHAYMCKFHPNMKGTVTAG